MRHTDPADGTARTRDFYRRGHRLLIADALKNSMYAVAAGQRFDALGRFPTALAHHVGGAEFLCQRDPIVVTTHDDDLLRAHALRRDDPAQSNRAVADDRDVFAGTHLRH